jgi:hypothetical protein
MKSKVNQTTWSLAVLFAFLGALSTYAGTAAPEQLNPAQIKPAAVAATVATGTLKKNHPFKGHGHRKNKQRITE